MSRPVILYENALEDATLTASSTASGYDVDSRKTRIPGDRWTSGASDTSHVVTAHLASAMLPTAFALTVHDLCGAAGDDPWLMQDDFDRADEAGLASPWTLRETGILSLVSNVATRAGDISGVRAVYTHASPGLDEDGYGWVQVKVRFDNVAGAPADHGAGVLLRWSTGPHYLYAVLKPSGAVILERYGASLTAPASTGALADNTWYTLRLEIDATSVRVYFNGTLKITYTGNHGVTATQVVGLVVEGDDPAACVTDFNDFGAGILTEDDRPRGVVVLRGGDNGTTWGYERAFVIETEATILVPFDDGVSHAWWQFEFPVGTARALTIGCLALGRRLDLTEFMAQGFDPAALKLVSHQARSNVGSYLGHVVRYPSQSVALKFGPAGLSTTDFFDVTGTPSWRDFLRSTWAIGRAFWFGWDLTHQPNDAWFAMVPANATTGSGFITAIRRGWTFTFDVLVEKVIP